jgi:hypothetical protein
VPTCRAALSRGSRSTPSRPGCRSFSPAITTS